jgi:hypothetical protein
MKYVRRLAFSVTFKRSELTCGKQYIRSILKAINWTRSWANRINLRRHSVSLRPTVNLLLPLSNSSKWAFPKRFFAEIMYTRIFLASLMLITYPARRRPFNYLAYFLVSDPLRTFITITTGACSFGIFRSVSWHFFSKPNLLSVLSVHSLEIEGVSFACFLYFDLSRVDGRLRPQ